MTRPFFGLQARSADVCDALFARLQPYVPNDAFSFQGLHPTDFQITCNVTTPPLVLTLKPNEVTGWVRSLANYEGPGLRHFVEAAMGVLAATFAKDPVGNQVLTFSCHFDLSPDEKVDALLRRWTPRAPADMDPVSVAFAANDVTLRAERSAVYPGPSNLFVSVESTSPSTVSVVDAFLVAEKRFKAGVAALGLRSPS